MRLAGKTALIAGGSSGIGLATARLFVSEGAQVAITGENQSVLDAAVKELGPSAVAFKTNVADADARERLFKSIGERFGALDILFINGGITENTVDGGADEESFIHGLQLNVTGVFFTVQGALPHLGERASVIVNGSAMTSLGAPGARAYATSKAAVRAMARVLTADLSPRGLRVNVLVPGTMETLVWGRNVQAARLMRPAAQISLGRWGHAKDIAHAVLHLASNEKFQIPAREMLFDCGANGYPLAAAVLSN